MEEAIGVESTAEPLPFRIRHRESGAVLFEYTGSVPGATLPKLAVERAALRRVDLRGADLRGLDLEDAYLEGADLRGADLNGSLTRGATFENAALAGATWCDGSQISQRSHFSGWMGPFYVLLYDQHLHAGCQLFGLEEFAKLSDEDMLRRGGKDGLRFLRDHRSHLVGLMRARQPSVAANGDRG